MQTALRRMRVPISAKAAIAVLAAGAVAVLALAAAGSAPIVRLDLLVYSDLRTLSGHELTEWSFRVTDLAGTRTALAVALFAAVAMAWRGHWRGAATVALSAAATQVVVQAIKVAVERPRPEAGIVEAHGYSFPSAHSATSVAVYGAVAFVLARESRGAARWAVAALGAAMVVAVGLTRVYLGAHYATDVVAGWLTGALLVALVWRLASRLRDPRAATAAA